MNTKPLAPPFVIANLTILFLASAATAHDSWLVADRHTVNDGDHVWLAVITGPTFPPTLRAARMCGGVVAV